MDGMEDQPSNPKLPHQEMRRARLDKKMNEAKKEHGKGDVAGARIHYGGAVFVVSKKDDKRHRRTDDSMKSHAYGHWRIKEELRDRC